MLYSDARRYPGNAGYPFPTATTAVAALAHLREQTLPKLIEPPRFRPRGQALALEPEWLRKTLAFVQGRAMFAAVFAALVLAVVTVLPAWAAIQDEGPTAPGRTVLSSAGVTGTASTRVEDLGVATYVGQLPFLQQLRFYDALSGNAPAADRFVAGARQASLASYMQDVGFQLTLPYISDATSTAQSFNAWEGALEAQRQAAAARAAASARGGAWQGPPVAAGTRLSSIVTFYACVGDGFCGRTASGVQVGPGSAACSSNLPFGTRFRIEGDPSGRVFVCNDRGALSSTWVDVWFYSVSEGRAWQSIVGSRAEIVIVG